MPRLLTRTLAAVTRLRPLLASALFCVVASTASAAPGAQLPTADLRVGHEHQRGGFVWGEWTQRSGDDGCVGLSADGTGRFPAPLRLAPGEHKARFVLHSPLEPSLVEATSHRHPASGASTEFDVTLQPRVDQVGTTTAWRALISVPVPPRQHYLDLYVEWPLDECGPPRHLFQRFHLAGPTIQR